MNKFFSVCRFPTVVNDVKVRSIFATGGNRTVCDLISTKATALCILNLKTYFFLEFNDFVTVSVIYSYMRDYKNVRYSVGKKFCLWLNAF